MICPPKVELQERIKNWERERERKKFIKMKSMMWLDANVLQTNINDKYKKKKKNFWYTEPWSQKIGSGPWFL